MRHKCHDEDKQPRVRQRRVLTSTGRRLSTRGRIEVRAKDVLKDISFGRGAIKREYVVWAMLARAG